jgi:predicted TIM-barrel fold metal-dependent hydrolase
VTDLIFAGATERYPDIRFLIPHCGATLPILADRIELFRRLMPGSQGRPQASLTTRQQLQRFWYDLAGTPFPAQATALVDAVGEGRLLFGSDYCWTPAAAVAHHVAAVEQAPADWRSITAANARRLLADGRTE